LFWFVIPTLSEAEEEESAFGFLQNRPVPLGHNNSAVGAA
jgi:hypothetical protein